MATHDIPLRKGLFTTDNKLLDLILLLQAFSKNFAEQYIIQNTTSVSRVFLIGDKVSQMLEKDVEAFKPYSSLIQLPTLIHFEDVIQFIVDFGLETDEKIDYEILTFEDLLHAAPRAEEKLFTALSDIRKKYTADIPDIRGALLEKKPLTDEEISTSFEKLQKLSEDNPHYKNPFESEKEMKELLNMPVRDGELNAPELKA